jgi:SecD/SecF fusion protein
MTHSGDPWKIESTGESIDRLGRKAVAFRLDPAGGQMMSRLTGPHVNQPMAIVLDGQVYSAPNLNSQIGSSGIIEGEFSQSEINYLTRVLAAGALEARLSDRPIATNTLGPTIGADNLNRGLMACLYSIIAVAGFMLVYYFGAGFIAIIALAANGLFIFGVMAMIEGTFTLPGLAGIALTIGTAVDANILIYERIREELEKGEVDLRGAVRLGYEKALSAIVDSNLTNLVVCVALITTGTTEVKGFAYTMTIGIVGTLFTALFMTRVIYAVLIEYFGLRRLPVLATTVPAVKRLLEPNINWIGLRHVLVPLSIILVLGSWTLVISRGAAIFDTEFRGGVSATMRTAIDPATNQRLQLKQLDVESRIQNIGVTAEAGPVDPANPNRQAVLRELRNAEVLTVGDTQVIDGLLTASQFQIKAAVPSELGEDSSSNELIISAIVDEFGDQLDVTRPLEFAGLNSTDHSQFTFPIANPELGVNIKQPQHRQNVRSFLGGVAVVLKDITPPVTTEEVAGRIRRMRDQPDFRDAFGREVQVVGLDAADPTDPSKGFTSLAVLVTDPLTDYGKVDFEIWDSRLAAREWALVSHALERPATLEQISEFSSAVAQTFRANAIVAVFLSIAGILVYIWVRFGSLRYSAGAVLALAHDVSIGIGALALSQYIATTAFGQNLLLLEFHIDLEVVAAVLTLIGYSLNDTIVILDRIRENRGKLQFPTAEIVNKSINQTFSRTVLTNLTMIISLMVLYIVGGPGIRAFAYVMLVGMIVGTYSSVAIAAPMVFKGHDKPATKGAKREIEPVVRETVPVGR